MNISLQLPTMNAAQKIWTWSHLPKKSLMENFIFCAVEIKHSSFLSKETFHVDCKSSMTPNLMYLTDTEPFF